MLNCIAVGLGGFLGSVCRYLAGQIPLGRDWGFPVRTLAINLIGSFLIGAVTALALKRAAPDPRLVLFLKAGVCGGFTTFSTFSLEAVTLFQNGKYLLGGAYILASVALCVAGVLLGQALAQMLANA